ncbi:MAG TPA: hypothetical protein VEI02_06095 [Planctomycetota bacterium]|nr:hypothetical protein [Planctomycetota bacterium]
MTHLPFPARAPWFRAALVVSLVLFAGGCRRPSVAPSTPPPPTGPSPAEQARIAAAERAAAEDAQWLALKNKIPNHKERVEQALAKLNEAAKIASEKFNTATTDAEKNAAGKEVRRVKNEAFEIWEALEEQARAIHPELWDKAFRTEQTRWEHAMKKVPKRAGM